MLDLKALRKRLGSKALSFASAGELESILGVRPGSVSALAILNDKEHTVHFCIDSEFMGGLVAAHPMENTATLFLSTDDLIALTAGFHPYARGGGQGQGRPGLHAGTHRCQRGDGGGAGGASGERKARCAY